ncbi:sulfotransferase [Actinoplanes awajinensis]|uniref:Sulfotransferase n=1 Tax=Actinoplanes awajinensis subsp. mycoplanecinus TaxID=135947 RepID=A0A117ML36_9ACTN|nr:sulfotransferase [Actinoplanes awajinensis]KUL23349.1 sulfotransferase [Actinoplanes awajinensis subsp. mycoplanecinus]
MSSDRPIFVVGCPRSGTTMLQLMLHAHPRIALPPESRFLLTAYRRRHEFGDLRDPGRHAALARSIVNSPQFEDLGLDRAETIAAITAAPPTLGSAVGTVFQRYAERFGKPRWGDKRPAYLRHLPVIRRLFPDAQIITIMRDGRDCVASLKDTPWPPHDLATMIDHWARSADAALTAARRYPADVHHQIRYEDLVADPEHHLRAICRFLGEEYDPAMTHPCEQAREVVPEYKTWHSLTREQVTAARVSSWQTRLDEAEVRRCEAVFGDRLARFGYQASAVPRSTPAVRATRAWLGLRHRLTPARMVAEDCWGALRSGSRGPALAARLTTTERAYDRS